MRVAHIQKVERFAPGGTRVFHPGAGPGGDVGDLLKGFPRRLDTDHLQPLAKRGQGQSGVVSAIKNRLHDHAAMPPCCFFYHVP